MRPQLVVLTAEDHARFRVAIRLIAVLTLALLALFYIAFQAAHAQGVAAGPAPTLSPDATALLVRAGLGRFAAGVASLIFVGGFVIAHAMPWLPPPSNKPGGRARIYAFLYAWLNFIAGNYGRALNATQQ